MSLSLEKKQDIATLICNLFRAVDMQCKPDNFRGEGASTWPNQEVYLEGGKHRGRRQY